MKKLSVGEKFNVTAMDNSPITYWFTVLEVVECKDYLSYMVHYEVIGSGRTGTVKYMHKSIERYIETGRWKVSTVTPTTALPDELFTI